MPKLKKCPFCGGIAGKYEVIDPDSWKVTGYFIRCIACGCGTLEFAEKDEAIERWNSRGRRKALTPLDGQVHLNSGDNYCAQPEHKA